MVHVRGKFGHSFIEIPTAVDSGEGSTRFIYQFGLGDDAILEPTPVIMIFEE